MQRGRDQRIPRMGAAAKAIDAAVAAANAAHASAASLRYVSDTTPGIRRKRAGEGFTYIAPNGRTVREAATLDRIKRIVIPPAWTDVWISPTANGHVQATGRDAKGRKQHRYHARWREVRDENKYARLAGFARALPRIREQVGKDLTRRGMTRQRVIAMVVHLLEHTYIRIGNEEYARSNGSYGLTTLTDDHVDIRGARLRFNFRGKSGKEHLVELNDKRLAALVKRSRDLPGEVLFQYVDEDGHPYPLDSADVNQYLREIAGDEFTAKDFRTWAGTLLAARALAEASEEAGGVPLTKSAIARAVKETAGQLGNTPSVCRKCYIHPVIIEAFQDARALAAWNAAASRKSKATVDRGLSTAEASLVHFLEAKQKIA